MKVILKIILVIIILLLLFLCYLTWKSKQVPEQAEFLKGTVPNPTPSGLYKGSTTFYRAAWLGKTFYPDKNTGDNSFAAGDTTENKYPFITYAGPGFRDAGLQTFKIDYKLPTNQFWIRPILDEIVEVSPGKYLGKIHYRLIPGFPFTIGYFRLEK